MSSQTTKGDPGTENGRDDKRCGRRKAAPHGSRQPAAIAQQEPWRAAGGRPHGQKLGGRRRGERLRCPLRLLGGGIRRGVGCGAGVGGGGQGGDGCAAVGNAVDLVWAGEGVEPGGGQGAGGGLGWENVAAADGVRDGRVRGVVPLPPLPPPQPACQ